MKLHHVAAYVRDLERTRKFYEDYFGATVCAQHNNPKTGLKLYYLAFDGGCIFEIMSKPDIAAIGDSAEHIGYTHLSFTAKDKDYADRLTDRLRNDGYTIFREPRITSGGAYESCVSDPDGNRIEIEA